MPKFNPEGITITLDGVELDARGWEVDGMVLVDITEIALELGFRMQRTMTWDGDSDDMAFNVDLKYVGPLVDDTTKADEIVAIVDEVIAKEEVEPLVPHELQRPVRGPIRRLIHDPDAPRGVETPSLRVPPSSPDSEAYRMDDAPKSD